MGNQGYVCLCISVLSVIFERKLLLCNQINLFSTFSSVFEAIEPAISQLTYQIIGECFFCGLSQGGGGYSRI